MSWLERLKVGDEVAIIPGLQYGDPYLAKIERFTKTQIIIGHKKFGRADGYQIGGDHWNRHKLREPTPEIRASIRKREMVSKLDSVKWREFNNETLERILELTNNSQAESDRTR